jgi:hypothetical protein
MDEDLRKQIQVSIDLNKENNDLLKKIRRTQKLNQIYKIFYWIVIVGFSYGAYQFIQPYLTGMMDLYSMGSSVSGSNINNLSDVKNIENLLNSYMKN